MSEFLLSKIPRHKSREFLQWAKRRGGICCVCGSAECVELHHWGPRPMGRKCSDLFVARLCREHHEQLAGKRFQAFSRGDDLETYCDLLHDNLALLHDWAILLEARTARKIEISNW